MYFDKSRIVIYNVSIRGSTLITCEKVIKTYENSELVEWNSTTRHRGLKSEKNMQFREAPMLAGFPKLPQRLKSTCFLKFLIWSDRPLASLRLEDLVW